MPSQNVLRIAYFGVSGKSEGRTGAQYRASGLLTSKLNWLYPSNRGYNSKDRLFALLNLANDLDSQNMSAVPA
jgi:hypothetical protein